MKVYSSFEEIDKDLAILKLKKEIDEEQLKLSANELKASVAPVKLVTNFAGSIAKNAVILKAVSKIFKRKK